MFKQKFFNNHEIKKIWIDYTFIYFVLEIVGMSTSKTLVQNLCNTYNRLVQIPTLLSGAIAKEKNGTIKVYF